MSPYTRSTARPGSTAQIPVRHRERAAAEAAATGAASGTPGTAPLTLKAMEHRRRPGTVAAACLPPPPRPTPTTPPGTPTRTTNTREIIAAATTTAPRSPSDTRLPPPEPHPWSIGVAGTTVAGAKPMDHRRGQFRGLPPRSLREAGGDVNPPQPGT